METKREFRYFTIFDFEKEQEYLRRRHKEGWKFVKVNKLGVFHFEKCQPEDVVYQLDYNKDKAKDEYIQMFADCGWEYIQDYADYSYFRKSVADMQGEEEIFCDASSRVAMMEKAIKGRLTPLLVIFFACLMPQFVLQLNLGNYGVAALLGTIQLIYIVVFIGAYVAYSRYKAKVEG